MATPEPSTDLPATFMSTGKKGKKSKYYEDVHGTRNPAEHFEGIAEDCESSDPDTPPTAFNKTNKKRKNKKTPTSTKAMDPTAVNPGDEIAAKQEVEPIVNFADFVHDLNEYAEPGADASSDFDVLYHEALQEHAIDPALTAGGVEQDGAVQDSTNADRNEYSAPTAVMDVRNEHETTEQNVGTSSTINGHVVDSETPPTTSPKPNWKRLPVKANSMFKKVDLLNTGPDGADDADDDATVDNEPVAKIVKTRKRGRPSKTDKLAERNAKKAKAHATQATQASNDVGDVPATRHSRPSRSVQIEPAPTPAQRGRPSKTSTRPQVKADKIETRIKQHALRSRGEDDRAPAAAGPRDRSAKAVKFTGFGKEPASTPARARGRPSKTEESAPALSSMRAAKKAAKNAAPAAKGGPVTRTRSQELKALIGKSSLRSAAKSASLKNLKNGRDAWKKEKKSNKAKAGKLSKVAPKATELSESKSIDKIDNGMVRRRKRRGVCWTTKKSKKSTAVADIAVIQKPVVEVVIGVDEDFDRSEFIFYDDL